MPIRKGSLHAIIYICLSIAIPVSVTAEVLTVGPGGDFLQITDALAVAADGDILLVEPGGYVSIVIDNLGVSVVADSGGTLTMGKVTVKNIAAHQAVVLSGVHCQVSPFADEIALTMLNNQGSVRCEDCYFAGSGAPNFYFGNEGAWISSCDDAAFTRCTFKGGWGSYDGDGGHGMEAAQSTVVLHDCTLSGGKGGEEVMVNGVDGGHGGDGLHAVSTFVFASGSEFKGGNGGDGSEGDFYYDPGDGGHGGDGIQLDGTQSAGWLLDNTTTGGEGGEGGANPWPPGAPGEDGKGVNAPPPAVVHSLPGTAHHLEITSPAREGETLQVVLTGEPGNDAFVLFALDPGHTFIPRWQGSFLLSLSPFPLFSYMGQLSTGSLTVPVTVPALGAGIEGVKFHTQSGFIYPTGRVVLGTAQTLILLDSSF